MLRCRGGAGGAEAVQVVQGGCRGGAGGAAYLHRLPATSAPQQAYYPVQGGAGGARAGTPQVSHVPSFYLECKLELCGTRNTNKHIFTIKMTHHECDFA